MPVGCACVSAASVSPETRDSDDEALEAYESDLARRDPPASPSTSHPADLNTPFASTLDTTIEDQSMGSAPDPAPRDPGIDPSSSTGPARDALGFPLVRLDPAGVRARARCDALAAKRSPRWDPYRTFDDDAWANLPRPPTGALKTLVRKGVPPDLRPRVWLATSGASAKRAAAPADYYASLVAAPADRAVADQIQLDLNRTFPENPRLETEEGTEALRRVLVAYANHDPATGYCQGMNYCAAFAWLVAGDEESAFWLLTCLLQDVCAPGVHARDIHGTMSEFTVLHHILRSRLPRLARRLDARGVELVMIASKWLLCFLTESFPPETTARVLDAVFSEGIKVWYRVIIAMLKMNERALMGCEQLPDVMRTLDDAFRKMHDRDALMRFAFRRLGTFSRREIAKFRAKVEKEERKVGKKSG